MLCFVYVAGQCVVLRKCLSERGDRERRSMDVSTHGASVDGMLENDTFDVVNLGVCSRNYIGRVAWDGHQKGLSELDDTR